MVAVAVPVAPPLVAVAVMVQEAGAPGAVYCPAAVIVPQLALQVTATLAENCCAERICRVTAEGLTATVTSVTEAIAFAPEPSVVVAVTVHRSAEPPAVKNPAVTELPVQFVAQVTLEPLEVVAENCSVPLIGMVAVSGEIETVVPDGIDTLRGRFWLPPAVSEMFRLPEKEPTVAELNWTVTVQLPPPETAPVQVLAEIENFAEPVRVTVGVTEPVPTLVAVKVLVIGVEIVVCCVHDDGEMESGMNVCWPVTVTVAVAVEPPLVAVAVMV